MKCDNCPTKSIPVNASDTNIVITGLTPGVQYNLDIAAANVFGKGPDSMNIEAYSARPGMDHKL